MSRRSLTLLLGVLSTLTACGGGGGGGPSVPTPVGPTFSVMGAVFYDENGSGTLDPGENTRVPDVVVEIGGRSARSSKVLGEFTVEGVAAGTPSVTVRRGSLPPYYVPPGPLSVTLPQSQGLLIPLTLPIGPNRPNVYMGFGDSITVGQGSSDDMGYRFRLQEKLAAHFGRGMVLSEGIGATRSNRGAERIDESLRRARPAYTLIHYGTNDWNVGECKFDPPCFTIDSLRDIVLSARGSQSLPVLSTIIPGNPESLQQPDRNDWTAAQNERIRGLAREMNVPLADPHALFLKDATPARLFVDHVHPSDPGYDLMAEAFFAALATPAEASSSGYSPPLFFAPPGAAPAARAIVGAGRRP
ncbi:MAG TPA: SGNH/GDSL hydrolase family protein [Vicinamibacteria bacterium]|nr:SGNH/GDSL hydrolase family protein [Vicinamibacteria bacterium]